MPELPEVEIVKQSLDRKIKLKKIKKIIIKNRNLRFKLPKNFEKILQNKIIKKVDRFSKYIILRFEDISFCIIHLGMSGTIHLIKKDRKYKYTNTSFYNSPNLPARHNHVIIEFDELKMIYNDPRRFGFFIYLGNKNKLEERFKHFGPEPFSKTFTTKYVFEYFKNKEKNIKNFLLDQNFVSGIGNIYASEILFFCGICPLKKAKKITIKECKKIIHFSRYVLKKAIKRGGSSIKNFKNISGSKGFYQNEFKVYDRKDLKCLKHICRGKIKKKKLSNRSTFFCNICQK
ncbi:bifunctional DNA-formamidopyrimidine glycosylase/DNA-(apurinic or apyrimidinic site) lyase [Candidatus Pelagibacter sp.]|nr:bifunctional DNA-formamidopyrimidine glycosylase/DNA-(apurinic or apyrimidinic site) lyase [Candidatus Pelagibacter sp.]MDA9663363.1 bifunctional DNA-formamidopyrimidine glycosylase/DNA-(apurinic or apyrimidinic site) lyase [Candidatus Pelagibacter sp.]